MIVDNEQINDLNSFLNINERGSETLVFQLGSHSIKFGLASQLTPFVIPNCIAHRKIEKETSEMQVDEEGGDIVDITKPKTSNITSNLYDINDTFLSNLLNIEQDIIKRQLKMEQKVKGKKMGSISKSFSAKNYENSESDFPERKNFEQTPGSSANLKKAQAMSYDLNDDIGDNNYKWTSIINEPANLIGREALTIQEIDKYIIRYPIKYGMFNISPDYSYQAVLDDLYKIIEFCVTQFLQIKKQNFSAYYVVLIIPDLFIKQQVKGLVNLFLRDFNFKGIILHTESVMSSFGGALQSSCVVDVGSSKISVCCIEEGMIIEETMLRKNYGGDDITKLLYMMLSRKVPGTNKQILPIENFDFSHVYHFRIIEKLKESECEFPSIQNPSSQFPPKTTKLWLHRKNQNTKLYALTLTEPIYIPPLSLFYPEIFESFRNVSIPYIDSYTDIYSELYSDPEDIMPDLMKALLTTAEPSKKEEKDLINLNLTSSVKKSKNDDDDSMSVSRSDENSSQIYDEKNINAGYVGKKNTYENMFKLLSIEDMICQSIMSVSSPELRKRLANAILLVGGSVKFKGMIDYLEDRLIDKLTVLDNEIDRVEIINFPHVDSKTLTWIGGTIIPKLDSSKDMWISRDRWVIDIDKADKPDDGAKGDSKDTKAEGKDGSKDVKDNASNMNDDESRKETDTIIGGKEKTEKEKSKKKEKHLDGGVNLIREKSAFQW